MVAYGMRKFKWKGSSSGEYGERESSIEVVNLYPFLETKKLCEL